MTLMELLVVISILALLAMLAIPKLIDVYERSRSGVEAYSLTDTARMIEIFYGVNKKYPDGWDTLMDTSGAMYANLNPNLKTPRTFFSTATLTPEQILSLNNSGMSHVFLHSTAAGTVPSDSGNERHHMGTGTGHDGTTNVSTFVTLNTAAGTDGFDLLVNEFNVVTNTSAGSEASSTALTNFIYVVLGLGPRSTIVSNTIQSAPLFEAADPTKYYSRGLAVFQVPNTGGGKAKLVGILGPDGRSLKLSLSDYQTGVVPH